MEDIQLALEAATVEASQGLAVSLVQEGLRADTSNGAGDIVGATLLEGVVL